MRSSQLWIPVLAAASAAIIVAVLGASMTDLGPWYQGLKKPVWQPADWAFGPGWTIIFAFAALSGITAWRAAPTDSKREWIIGYFAINGVLNIVWSALFFRFERPDWALIEVIFLWLSIFVPIIAFAKYSKSAAAFLLPYLVWVTFAAALNYEVCRLNGFHMPF